MGLAEEFSEIVRLREPLGPYTHLKIGGPVDYLVQPRTATELAAVLKYCKRDGIPLRMLGGGHNLLVREEAVPGAVLRLAGGEFNFLRPGGNGTVAVGGGTPLYDLIAHAVKSGLGGLETLVGIRGTVGGSVRCNVGDRSGEIGSAVRRVAVMTDDGREEIRNRDELNFTERGSDLDEPVILWVEFGLSPRAPAMLIQRMRKAWITRKSSEPLTFQASVRLFRNPAGATAHAVIDRAGLAKLRIGGAELSERNSNYVVANPGTTSADILQLIARVRDTVKEKLGIALEQELHVW